MIDLLTSSGDVLGEAGFSTERISINDREVLVFEGATVLGFLFVYENSAQLIARWESDGSRAVSDHQFGLRRAGPKAWNAYTVFLAAQANDNSHSASLSAIEEDLVGTRKIACASVLDSVDVRRALLALLPLQAAPRLEAVDMQLEIRQRATELQSRAVDAFLLASDEAIILQVLEDEP